MLMPATTIFSRTDTPFAASADVDAVRMMHDIMGMFENVDASGDKG